jgi:hypothetical protein
MFKRIKEWGDTRNIYSQAFSPNDFSFIVEEVVEGVSNLSSSDANIVAKEFVNENFIDIDENRAIDALGDIVVFATNGMYKLGYNPEQVMNEVLKEIESRNGEIVNGKFEKYQDDYHKSLWYKADFSKCKL